MKSNIIFTFIIGLSLFSCNKDNNPTDLSEWLIPRDEVRDGGPGKDGIPALEDPPFTDTADVSYLRDSNLVLGIVSGSMARAYPHAILDWHEIVNDHIGDTIFAVTYCPLTGTGTAWDRNINGAITSFGVSGLLYNTNLIPYDRRSQSNWSQMRLDCVNGDLIGEKVQTFQLVETTWKTWKEMYPNTEVLSINTGYSRNYGVYPYFDYKVNQDKILFPVNNIDTRIPNKERVLGIVVNEKAKVYSIELFRDGISEIKDNFNGLGLVVVGSMKKNFIVSFHSTLADGTELNFEAVQDSLPIILKDNEGNRWDVFGNAVSGPKKGEKLKSTKAFIGYWLVWAAFYPEVEIYP